jgi:hypothetical protein
MPTTTLETKIAVCSNCTISPSLRACGPCRYWALDSIPVSTLALWLNVGLTRSLPDVIQARTKRALETGAITWSVQAKWVSHTGRRSMK